jgi:hypothetical protein
MTPALLHDPTWPPGCERRGSLYAPAAAAPTPALSSSSCVWSTGELDCVVCLFHHASPTRWRCPGLDLVKLPAAVIGVSGPHQRQREGSNSSVRLRLCHVRGRGTSIALPGCQLRPRLVQLQSSLRANLACALQDSFFF